MVTVVTTVYLHVGRAWVALEMALLMVVEALQLGEGLSTLCEGC